MRKAPLSGIRVIELAGLGPAPHAGQLLADMGANVIAISRPGQALFPVENRGKRSVVLDLKRPAAVEAVRRLAEDTQIFIEGFRPGVAERLGLGPEDLQARNPALVYGRMTGWGQTGPWSGMAGHDINYIGLTGALHAIGEPGRPPVPPLNLVGDYGGGSLYLVAGLLAALNAARETGRGEVVDAAITDGTLSMFGLMFSLHAAGRWRPERGANWLDGGAPYYRCYTCADGRFFAVGALEPQFFRELLDGLGIDPADYGDQHDTARHPEQAAMLAARFREKTRDEWARVFDGRDACATPVLDYLEAPDHPQNAARRSVTERDGVMHPHPAPRFGKSGSDWAPPPVPDPGADTAAVLREAGLTEAEIARLTGDTPPD